MRSSAPTRPCSARGSSSPGTARAAPSSRRCCRTWPRWSTRSAIIKSVHTDQFNHAPAQIFFNTGFSQPGRPSLGSWVIYGLGSEAQDLPAFVVMSTGSGISGGSANWSSGFLPTIYTGVRLRNQGDPILNVSSPPGVDAKLQRDSLDLLGSLNSRRLQAVADPEIATRIASYEMAFRLQTSAPELMDLKSESKATLEMYGADPDKPSFARACLLARRMIERGVRFVNIYHEGWDAHSDVAGNLEDQLRRHRSGLGRAGHGPQAARPARRHAGDLGRRVRPDADGRIQRRPGPQPGPRPPPAGLHDVDGRRRHQARHRPTAPPTTWASTSPRTRSTSTTSRPRSFTCSASTTRSSPSTTPAATSA